jgi:guanylate kinase
MAGKLILLAGPSGSGKGTLMAHVRRTYPQFVYPTSWTTRQPREGEQSGLSKSGKTYKFVSVGEFIEAQKEGKFLESDHHFNNYYGTPAQEVLDALAAGQTVFQELEVYGVRQILEKVPRSQIGIIFITAGSWEELAQRIRAREAMSDDEFEKRKVRYNEEMEFSTQADCVLVNREGKLEETIQKFDEALGKILAA